MHNRQRGWSSSSRDSSRHSPSRSKSPPPKKQSLKSGLNRGAQHSVKLAVQWPTDVMFRGPLEQTIHFEDLTKNELTLGFIRLLQEHTEKEARCGLDSLVSRAILAFREQWTDDAANYTWSTVLGYIKLVFLGLEQAKLSWTDASKLQAICDHARQTGRPSAKHALTHKYTTHSPPGKHLTSQPTSLQHSSRPPPRFTARTLTEVRVLSMKNLTTRFGV